MQKEIFDVLVDKYLSGTADQKEKEILYEYMDHMAAMPAEHGNEFSSAEMEAITAQLYQRISEEMHKESRKDRIEKILSTGKRKQTARILPMRSYYRWAAAAVVLFAVGATWLLLSKKETTQSVAVNKIEVAPGKPGAKLKLSDGRMIMIDTVKDGLIAMDGKINIYKENGQIIYKGQTDQTLYNEIVTDKGRQWSATLPDGSTAWLNAASTLRYPLHFTGKERLVVMTGEASFKVVHNNRQPFKVQTRNQIIQDIGTEFNVNAYTDEPVIRTTLIEGAASVAISGFKVLVRAGEEAIVNADKISTGKADTDKAIAWRNGTFSYSHAGVAEIMRQLGRWYNVEIVYENGVPDETFTGDIGRGLTLEQALKVLEKMSAHFKIEEGKRVVITP